MFKYLLLRCFTLHVTWKEDVRESRTQLHNGKLLIPAVHRYYYVSGIKEDSMAG